MRGGLTDLRKIAAIADTWGMTMAPHLFPELNVQLLASIPNGLWIEDMGLSDDLWVEPVPVVNGMITAPERYRAGPLLSSPRFCAIARSRIERPAAELPLMTPPSLGHERRILAELERKVLWLASWTIHHANHVRENTDGLKVGGHQASSASLATIMTALYFHTLRPQDRVAVKPHASPIFHAIQYLLGRQSRDKLENFRGYKGAQSYPSRTKDTDDVDFSTGSVGLGVAQTLFALRSPGIT